MQSIGNLVIDFIEVWGFDYFQRTGNKIIWGFIEPARYSLGLYIGYAACIYALELLEYAGIIEWIIKKLNKKVEENV